MPTPVRPRKAPSWKNPNLWVPVIGSTIIAFIGFGGDIVRSFEDPSPAAVNCSAALRTYEQIYDDHPNSKLQLPANSQDEIQCHVNEFMSQLTKKNAPAPQPSSS